MAPEECCPDCEMTLRTFERLTKAPCCLAHDGPHVHGCTRPRIDGREHRGACLLSAEEAEDAAPEVDSLLHHDFVYVGMSRDGTEMILACGRCGLPKESVVHRREPEPEEAEPDA